MGTINGDAKDNSIGDTSGSDQIYAEGGKDGVYGNSDNDPIFLGGGNDARYMNTGNEPHDGGVGYDTLCDSDGSDLGYAGFGDGYMDGDGLNSMLLGNETLYSGADDLRGDAGNELVDGGVGLETLYGVTTNDTIDGSGIQTKNDFKDLSSWYDTTPLTAVNDDGSNFGNALVISRQYVSDGTINGVDYSNQLGLNCGTLTCDTTNVNCFTSGTRIKTRRGEVAVEDLRVGDDILTLDNGYQAVRWIGTRRFSAAELTAHPNLRPIRIRAGALGQRQPETDLCVSPQHRVLVRSKVAERMFGEAEVLIAARHLMEDQGIELTEDMSEVTYWHFLFETHQVVFSNGAATESLFIGSEVLRAVSPETRAEILAIFPSLAASDEVRNGAARLLISGALLQKSALEGFPLRIR